MNKIKDMQKLMEAFDIKKYDEDQDEDYQPDIGSGYGDLEYGEEPDRDFVEPDYGSGYGDLEYGQEPDFIDRDDDPDTYNEDIARLKNLSGVRVADLYEGNACGCGPRCPCAGQCDENCHCECPQCSYAVTEGDDGYKIMEDSGGADRLREISEEIQELAREALLIVKQNGDETAHERARRYWYGHIMSSAGSQEYMSGHSTTILDSANELRYSTGDFEKAAQELVEFMEENPEANAYRVAADIIRRNGYDFTVDELDEYMSEEGYRW